MADSALPGSALKGDTGNTGATGAVGATGATGPGYDGPQTILAQAATSYTYGLTDAGKYVRHTSGSATAITVPANATVAFVIGTHLDNIAAGGGQLTFAGAGGVTLNSAGGLKSRAQYSSITLIKVASDTWDVVGDTTT